MFTRNKKNCHPPLWSRPIIWLRRGERWLRVCVSARCFACVVRGWAAIRPSLLNWLAWQQWEQTLISCARLEASHGPAITSADNQVTLTEVMLLQYVSRLNKWHWGTGSFMQGPYTEVTVVWQTMSISRGSQVQHQVKGIVLSSAKTSTLSLWITSILDVSAAWTSATLSPNNDVYRISPHMFWKKHNCCLNYVYKECFFHYSYKILALHRKRREKAGVDVTNHQTWTPKTKVCLLSPTRG